MLNRCICICVAGCILLYLNVFSGCGKNNPPHTGEHQAEVVQDGGLQKDTGSQVTEQSPKEHAVNKEGAPKPLLDILFVVDTRKSMESDRKELTAPVTQLIQALDAQIKDKKLGNYQIAAISMDFREGWKFRKIKTAGVLQLRIVRSVDSLPKAVIHYTNRLIQMKSAGTSFPQGLENIYKALSPDALKSSNKGFLRPNASLMIVLLSGHDDCSYSKIHNATLPSSDSCILPSTVRVPGSSQKGILDALEPTSKYIDFLKGIQRKVSLVAWIGDPVDAQSSSDKSCTDRKQCSAGQQRCSYKTKDAQFCGGCSSRFPGFRYHQLLQAFNGEWTSICSGVQPFGEALVRAASKSLP